MLIISEAGIYKLIFRSHKPEAEVFQDWVCDVIKALRQASGLESYQAFQMADRGHQRKAMKRLHGGLSGPVRVDYIKANTLANKAVSSIFKHPRMVKKADMSPEMHIKRQAVLDDIVNLMTADGCFGLNLSISEAVYKKYSCNSAS